MIMTDSGFAAIEASSHGPLFRVMSWLGLTPRAEEQPFIQTPYVPMTRTPQPVMPPAPFDSSKLAESHAFNALVCARNGGFVEAESYFREAFTLDRKLDPASLTNFWQLPRQAHEAAKAALMACGREDDAVELVREMEFRSQPELVRAAS
ncbi:MAG: hypothetical protein ACRDHN_05935 [Thermomicrobiales bacterium]